ncbi:MAG: DUF177 domain-containing protein [Lentisphaeria bacterium]|nr:DUF177 domain-containing protein [Lentisphaeria bacterium]
MKGDGPLCLNIVDLPPEGTVLEGAVASDEIGLEDESRIRCPGPVRYRLQAAPIVQEEGVLVRGWVETVLLVMCDRCLSMAEHLVRADDVCHHYPDEEGNLLDLTSDVREDILLTFPQSSLCRMDCQGLCPSCGKNLNEGDCSCSQGKSDEGPWEALSALDLSPGGEE